MLMLTKPNQDYRETNTMHPSVYLLYDKRMALHHPVPAPSKSPRHEDFVAERPARIRVIYKTLKRLQQQLMEISGCTKKRFIPIDCRPADRETIELAHSRDHYETLLKTSWLSEEELRNLTVPNDLYFCHDTFSVALLACGGCVQCIDAVTDPRSESKKAIALVRPPGHHACRDEAMGFCYLNNIAVAAKHALHTGRARRVFVLDIDIHHGNGIEEITFDDPNIFYVSIHRAFYPGTGFPRDTGSNAGIGTNLNIAWERDGMGNVEYAAAFSELVLPTLFAYQPDLVIIAAGLDAAEGDLIGDCMLSPEMYYIMTQSVMETAGFDCPVALILEGGYNLEVISNCMEAMALAVLEEPWPLGDCNLEKYWTHADLALKEHDKRFPITRSAIASIKKSTRALARSQKRLKAFHAIQTPSISNPACSTTLSMEQQERRRRLSLLDSDRYPMKKWPCSCSSCASSN